MVHFTLKTKDLFRSCQTQSLMYWEHCNTYMYLKQFDLRLEIASVNELVNGPGMEVSLGS